MESQQPGANEAGLTNSGSKRGGWVTFPFIAATFMGLTLSGAGWMANLIVYLIQKFNVKSIDASQIFNGVNGFISLVPIVAAIVADSFSGSFSVISFSSGLSLLGVILLTLTATMTSLRPPPCEPGHDCQGPEPVQYGVLYAGIVLASLGIGGTRFTLATMGANQFKKTKDQEVFINWYFFILYVSTVVSMVGIAYVQENISWGLGFGLCAAASFVALAIFLPGKRFYQHEQTRGSPYTSLARVVVAAVRKRNLPLVSESADYHHENDGMCKNTVVRPTQSLRFLNRAALKSEEDINGLTANPWKLCTVEQVEDLKALIKILPLWTSSVLLSTPIGLQGAMTVLQALSMDRHVGPIFKIPAGSITVVLYLSCSIFIPVLDRLLLPTWQKLTNKSLTPLQRIGVGHVLNVLGMVTSALVESRRLKIAHSSHLHPGDVVPMLALWLIPQLFLVGMGEAFHFPGQVSLYYEEFPVSLRSTATAMVAVVLGIAYYMSTALVGLIRDVTDWLPDDINDGRLDLVYWTTAAAGLLNFGYYLVCSYVYRYRNDAHKLAHSVPEKTVTHGA